MAPKLTLTLDQSAERELADRVERLRPRGPPPQLNPCEHAVQFLRGVCARATMTLPAFYLFLGAGVDVGQQCAMEGYPGVVLKHALGRSSIDTISLSCRVAFDGTGDLSATAFSSISDADLQKVAKQWCKTSSRPSQEALAALCLLRSTFRDCSKSITDLLDSKVILGRRIALLRQCADNSAAHLSLRNYEFSTLDCAHVVAALSLIGEIIRSFDEPHLEPTYFDTLDEASWSAARQLFPATPETRLFQHIKVEMQARGCWQQGIEGGHKMLTDELLYAIGWY